MEAFRAHPGVQRMLPGLLERARRGDVLAAQAADELLATFIG